MLRVIQWATGSVGRHAVAAVHEHPDLDLIGALVYFDAKADRDVGDVCGIGPIGIRPPRILTRSSPSTPTVCAICRRVR